VIECEWGRQIVLVKYRCLGGIVSAIRNPARPSNKHGGHGVFAWVALRIRIHMEQFNELNVERGLLQGFPHRRLFG
jgi:hypothetical protein